MKIRFTALLAAALLLSGCVTAPQAPIPFSSKSLEAPTNRVAVTMSKLPAVDTQFPGAGCLLCLAAASIANSSLTQYTKTLGYEDLPQLPEQVADILRKKGAEVSIVAEPLDIASLPDYKGGPNTTRKDFTSLRAKYNADKLLVIQLREVGISRPYSSYAATGEPKAKIAGLSFLVNLSNNSYEWFSPLNVVKGADKWDEPPKFPGLTNAYYQAIEQAKDDITQPLVK